MQGDVGKILAQATHHRPTAPDRSPASRVLAHDDEKGDEFRAAYRAFLANRSRGLWHHFPKIDLNNRGGRGTSWAPFSRAATGQNGESMHANVVTSQQVRCGLFDFMANRMGVRVLHPGGYEATDRLLSKLNLCPDSHVLDLACGAGTTSLRIAHKFGCRVTGVDIAQPLIQQARDTAERDRRGTRVSFEVADALALPFGDACFDAVVAQAFFVLVNEGERALAQVCRVLKPGGRLGALELSWAQEPPADAYNELVENTCTQMIPRMKSFQEWEAFFSSTGLIPVETLARPMPSGMWQMARAEGLSNFLRIMRRMLADSDARTRMMRVQKTFAKHAARIGYGLYWFEKSMQREPLLARDGTRPLRIPG